MNIAKKIISFGLLLVMLFSFMSCSNNSSEGKAFGEKPEGFDEPMPEIWEEQLSGKALKLTSIKIDEITEITIGANITDIDLNKFWNPEKLENIYVEEGNEKFASDDGVLYSKSYQTLYKWPAKKPVTEVRDTVKYFAPFCFAGCMMPEDFEIPDEIITIGRGAFSFSNLKKLHIKSNVQSVGNWKFSKVTKLSSIGTIYPYTCKFVEISAPIVYSSFYVGTIETIVFNEGVKQIKPNSKKKRENLYCMRNTKYIEFPSSLEAIGNVSFPVNGLVESYTIPENVTYLAEYAFDDHYEKIPFWIHIACFMVDPIRVYRKFTTEFDCKSQAVSEYIAEKLAEWESNARKKDYR